MNTARRTIALALVVALAGVSALAQTARPRVNHYQIGQIISRVETDTATFRNALAGAVDNSRIDNTRREQNVEIYLNDFVTATSQLRARHDRRRAAAADVQLVLDRATLVDNFLRRNQNRLDASATDNWDRVRNDLQELAAAYGLTFRQGGGRWNRNNTAGGPYGNPNAGGYNNNSDRMLTGTYALDVSRSDNPRTQAEQATRTLPWRDRQRVTTEVLGRLEAPQQIAIERRGSLVTIASTRAPQINFEADGRERVESLPNGRTVRASARFTGDQLVVSSTGDRESDFTVTFNPVGNGQQLEVTRRISDVSLRTPVVVRSVYNRTSEVARFDIQSGGTYPTYTGSNSTGTDFVIPDGTTVVARLNNDLTTRSTREGDRFTMTVVSPSEYQGATLEGHVSNVQRSGRVTGRSGMTFNFDSLRLRDGRSYRFSGFVESARTVSGESVRIDNEGSVEEGGGSQTDRTVQRTAIGTAVGAIIGAIAGGGKGAAIGAVIGAGTGAGSVYVQGRDDLELLSGTELTLRASSPRTQGR